jgi:hypothetical protein
MEASQEHFGRWTAMATLSPVGPLWRLWLWLYYRVLSRWTKRSQGTRDLIELSMIGFARWSVCRPAGRPYLLFETNFNGDSDHYLEAFALVTPNGLKANWRGIAGFPGVEPVSRFQSFVNDHMQRIARYWSAYPHASTKMIRSALELRSRIDGFDERGATPEDFKSAYDGLIEGAQMIRNPATPAKGRTSSLSVLAPVVSGAVDRLAGELAALPDEGLMPDDTHFARWAVVDQLDPPHLLFSAWFDRAPGGWLLDLHRSLGDRAHAIWSHCGLADGGSEAFSALLQAHAVPVGLPFHAYDGWTVGEVREALDLAQRFNDFAIRTHGLPAAELQRRWQEELG